MPAIVWNEGLPSQASDATRVEAEWRSMETNIATGLGESFFWEGSAATSGGHSGASVGEMVLGSARCGIPNSMGTGGRGDGFLHYPADINGLVHVGSTWTGQLSHSAMLDTAGGIGNVGSAFSVHWLVQCGVINSSNGSETITFDTEYKGIPFMTIGPGTAGRDVHYAIRNEATTGFIIDRVDKSGGGLSSSRFYWMSLGTADI